MAKKAKSRTRSISRGSRRELSNFTFSSNPSGSLPFTKIVASIRSARSLSDVLAVLDLRLEDFGAAIGRTKFFEARRPKGFGRSYISMLSNGTRPTSQRMVKAIEIVLQQEISDLLGRPIGIQITRNSPWHFRLAATCEKHGPYELAGKRKHCPICGK